jgi:hypothetical protein
MTLTWTAITALALFGVVVFVASTAEGGWGGLWQRRRAITRTVGRKLVTFAYLVFAVHAAASLAIATIEHWFDLQVWSSVTGATFLWWGVRRLIDDTRTDAVEEVER